MPDEDGNETKPAVMIGLVALAGFVLAVRAIRRRSYTSAVCAAALFGVEAGWCPYRRKRADAAFRFQRTSEDSVQTEADQ